MKDPYQVLKQKKMEIEHLRREIEALHFVIPLLTEEADWIENGLALPVRFRGTEAKAERAAGNGVVTHASAL